MRVIGTHGSAIHKPPLLGAFGKDHIILDDFSDYLYCHPNQ